MPKVKPLKKKGLMQYALEDKFILCAVECKVAFINAEGRAYLTPEFDGDTYGKDTTLRGLVFAVIDRYGKDENGNRAIVVSNKRCGAV